MGRWSVDQMGDSDTRNCADMFRSSPVSDGTGLASASAALASVLGSGSAAAESAGLAQ